MKLCQCCHTSCADACATCAACGEASWAAVVADAPMPAETNADASSVQPRGPQKPSRGAKP